MLDLRNAAETKFYLKMSKNKKKKKNKYDTLPLENLFWSSRIDFLLTFKNWVYIGFDNVVTLQINFYRNFILLLLVIATTGKYF